MMSLLVTWSPCWRENKQGEEKSISGASLPLTRPPGGAAQGPGPCMGRGGVMLGMSSLEGGPDLSSQEPPPGDGEQRCPPAADRGSAIRPLLLQLGEGRPQWWWVGPVAFGKTQTRSQIPLRALTQQTRGSGSADEGVGRPHWPRGFLPSFWGWWRWRRGRGQFGCPADTVAGGP